MSPIAKKFFIAALIYFLLGLLIQAITIFDVWLGFNPFAYTVMVATERILLIGWLTQLALALIYDYWLWPIRPNYQNGQLIFSLINIGLPLVIVGQPGLVLLGGVWVGILAALGALLQLVAGIFFLREVLIFFKTETKTK